MVKDKNHCHTGNVTLTKQIIFKELIYLGLISSVKEDKLFKSA